MPIKACVFDAYGTLFDVTAAAREAAADPAFPELAKTWQSLAAHWRDKQLQYTWLRAVTGEHTDFWQVTADGLDWALEATGLHGNPDLRERLLQLYWSLSAYAEVPEMLRRLREAGLQTAILSNGSPDMLNGAVSSAGLSGQFDAVLSVQDVGVFKPSAKVYQLVEARLGTQPREVIFVSSNGWDAACATSFGFETVWVNRTGLPMDRLPGRPAHILSDLKALPELVAGRNHA
ncbi:haloacid dehalogenase type II [uncultured Lentibacter sp.]|uniref:haloacid dehalogenase type II n=1 Tax=uncultured Lentibacter sp. TaxID=1659309 RepID=UPI002603F45E|nr:haloacid dehalogenase type II [uncultured Lentibacter sp.]MCW1955329.1 haloacid dehalogenase type II [Roseobacter sp.]